LSDRHQGRGVVISGGTSGLGLAAAKRFVAEGARVWIMGSREQTLAAARAEVEVIGGSAGDIADPGFVASAIAAATAALGRIDVAFASAGIDGEAKGALDLSPEHFRRVMDVNVLGAFLLAQSAARQMTAGGAIVINASVNGLRAERDFCDYNASKAAAVMLARTLALDLADRAIAVTAICAGYVPTRMTEGYLDDPAVADEIRRQIPAGRFGTPDEVAGLVSFLAHPDAAYMTGGAITIDGGRSA
jgi:NAD(P)-dependent dehydrogenase (short-subunit alcohol dehydrogenase family)